MSTLKYQDISLLKTIKKIYEASLSKPVSSTETAKERNEKALEHTCVPCICKQKQRSSALVAAAQYLLINNQFNIVTQRHTH